MVGTVKTVSVKREGRKWFVVLTAEQPQPEPLPSTGSVVGIDVGITSFLTTSNGEHVANPRHGRKAAKKLEVAQQALSRYPRRKAKNRTRNHQRSVERVAAGYDASASTTRTRPRTPWSASTTSSRTKTSRSTT